MPEIILSPEEAPSFERFYNSVKSSPNNFSFWYPGVKGCGIPSPDSVVVPVPMDVMESFFMERPGDKDRIMEFVKTVLLPAIPSEWGSRVFLKNGCFSNKFRFSQCTPEVNDEALFRSVTNINMDSLCFDTGGNAELVARRLVGTDDDTFRDTIYGGMRLRPEIRVFYDFGRKKALYAANYWDRDYCHEAIGRHEDDKAVYEKVYPTLESVFHEQEGYVLELVHEKMRGVNLPGIWSVDLMYAENKWWLIDMAIGFMSAYWDPERIKAILGQEIQEI